MIYVALGANLPGTLGAPRATCEAALAMLEARGINILRCSRWYRTAPVPVSDQPWYVNAVVMVETGLPPAQLLDVLHEIEEALGRVRTVANAARVIDLDLLAYRDRIAGPPGPVLPHPRLHERAFVLLPLRDVAPVWRHPVSGAHIEALIAALPPDQHTEAME